MAEASALTWSGRAVAFCALGLLLAGCGSGSSATNASSDRTDPAATATPVPAPTTVPGPTTTTPSGHKAFAPDAFNTTDALLEQRLRSAGVSFGMIRVVANDGAVIHEHSIGGMSGSTPISIASSTKWLTAATLMTFVDRRVIGLDDDIAKWLPEFTGSSPPITVRQLLDHTSGVHDNACQTDGTPLAACVRTLASSSRVPRGIGVLVR